MPSVLVVPLRQRCSHMHLLDDVSPAHAGVVSTERNLAFLRCIRNDALLSAAEIVVKQILEPHSRDEQEVPAISAALLDVFNRSVTRHLAVVFSGCAERLVEFLQKVCKLEMRRCFEGIVVL